MARSARELSERLAGIRGTIAGGRAEAMAAEGVPTYAKLSLEELSGLLEYATIKEVAFLIAFIFRKSRDKSFGFHDDCFAS